ncbi:MAG TPA: hypothetical protein DC049_11775, partial [Spirochaetia bacterium]|nr:hypothetical protein [Spirochaetia bacterium]
FIMDPKAAPYAPRVNFSSLDQNVYYNTNNSEYSVKVKIFTPVLDTQKNYFLASTINTNTVIFKDKNSNVIETSAINYSSAANEITCGTIQPLIVDEKYYLWLKCGVSGIKNSMGASLVNTRPTEFSDEIIIEYTLHDAANTPPNVSCLTPSIYTNCGFNAELTVDKNFGFWSTNGANFVQFSTPGTNIFIDPAATNSQGKVILKFFGSNGTVSATNEAEYRLNFTAPVITQIGGSNISNSVNFTVNLYVNEQYGYWSTNGTTWQVFSSNTITVYTNTPFLLTYAQDVYGNCTSTNSNNYVWTEGPKVTISPSVNYYTNQALTVHLSVDKNYGYFCTNGFGAGPYHQFDTNGIDLLLDKDETGNIIVTYYGSNDDSYTPIKFVMYNFNKETPNIYISSGPATNYVTNESFTVSLVSWVNYGYWATNGGAGFSSWTQFGGFIPAWVPITLGGSSKSNILAYFALDQYGNNSGTNYVVYSMPVTNASPQVAISSPLENAVFNELGSITINAAATDDNTVTNVSFWYKVGAESEVLISSDTASPYSAVIAAAPAGNVQLIARAYDNDGAVSADSIVNITVYPVPAAHWAFDEGSGSTAYDSMSNFHGSITNAVFTTGRVNSALSFNGSNSMVELTTNTGISSNLAFCGWIKPSQASSSQGRIIGSAFYSNDTAALQRGWYLGNLNESNDNISFAVYSGSGASNMITLSNFFSAYNDNWVHVAGVFRPAEYISIYTNGILAISNTADITQIAYNNTIKLRLGARADTLSDYFTGLLDDWRLYDKTVSVNQLAQIAAAAPGAASNQAPIAEVTASITGGYAPLAVTFSAADSDSDGIIISRVWKVNGTVMAENCRAFTNIFDAGTYQVTYTVKDNNNSETVSTAGITAELRLAAPSGLSGRSVSTTKIALTWNDTAKEDGYFIYRGAEENSSSAEKIGIVLANVTNYNDESVMPGTLYWYWLQAFTVKDVSSISAGMLAPESLKGSSLLSAPVKILAEKPPQDFSCVSAGRITRVTENAKYVITNVPEGTEAAIYTIDGRLAANMPKADRFGIIRWDMICKNGRPAGVGTHVLIMKSGGKIYKYVVIMVK